MSVEPLLVSGFESRGFLQPQLVNAVVQIAALIDANDFFRCNGRHLTLRGVWSLVTSMNAYVGFFPVIHRRLLAPTRTAEAFPFSWVCGVVPQCANFRALEEGGSPSNLKSSPEKRVTRVLK